MYDFIDNVLPETMDSADFDYSHYPTVEIKSTGRTFVGKLLYQDNSPHGYFIVATADISPLTLRPEVFIISSNSIISKNILKIPHLT